MMINARRNSQGYATLTELERAAFFAGAMAAAALSSTPVEMQWIDRAFLAYLAKRRGHPLGADR